MRKLFTVIAMMLLWTVSLFAQAPQKMAYQAVVCDAEGKVVTNQSMGVKVSILKGAVDGTAIYTESHTTTSTSNGAINLEIGGGTTSDDFSAIDWSKGPYFIQSTAEVNGKSVTVTSQLLSVPYALYAEKSKIVDETVLRTMVEQILADNGYVPSNGTVTPPEKLDDSDIPVAVEKVDGLLPGKFSVSETRKVQFSKGNLQYRASDGVWRFAENQYDIVGYDNEKISATNSGWIDLFGYGTSGSTVKPYETSMIIDDYPKNDIAGTSADWGNYNAITNGGNKSTMWRTLSFDEMEYMLKKRPNADQLRASAIVCGVAGMIVLPDDWQLPEGVSWEIGAKDCENNVYKAYIWSLLERNGALFFPFTGTRRGENVDKVGSAGPYWTTSVMYVEMNRGNSMHLYTFHCGGLSETLTFGDSGNAVRLARTVTK